MCVCFQWEKWLDGGNIESHRWWSELWREVQCGWAQTAGGLWVWIVHPCVGVGDEDQKPFWFRRKLRLGDQEAQIPRLPSASCRECAGTRGDEPAGNSWCQAGEEHRLNADAASQHLASILSASQTKRPTLNRTIYNGIR